MQYKKSKKAQIKIQEMAFVLVAVIFLFSILFLFFARFQYSQLQESASEIRQKKTLKMLDFVSSMPELSCSDQTGCIDRDKLLFFSENRDMQKPYERLWSNSDIIKIAVKEVFPAKDEEFIIYLKQTDSSTITYSTFVSLCQETIVRPSCQIAKIKITMLVP